MNFNGNLSINGAMPYTPYVEEIGEPEVKDQHQKTSQVFQESTISNASGADGQKPDKKIAVNKTDSKPMTYYIAVRKTNATGQRYFDIKRSNIPVNPKTHLKDDPNVFYIHPNALEMFKRHADDHLWNDF